MSQHRQARRLASALNRVTVEAVEAQRAREGAVALVAGGDMAQQVQLEVEGKVGRRPVFLEKTVNFPYPFLMRVASTQSEGTLLNPHFAAGVELRNDRHIILDPQVRSWVEDDSQFITGAVVRVAVWSPDAPKLTTYSAIVHMTFFGYAAPAEDDSEG